MGGFSFKPVVVALIMSFAIITNFSFVVTQSSQDRLYFYYVDITEVTQARGYSEGYFEIPINYSDGLYSQKVFLVSYGGNVSLVKVGESATSFKILISNGTYGYLILNVTVEHNMSRELGLITYIRFSNDTKAYSSPYPEELLSKYVLNPDPLVVKYVIPEFENWLKERYKITAPTDISKTYLAVKAAEFIYGRYFIKYNASALPRTTKEVIESRQGDCDDMSRILLSILWYYGIPAKIVYGYVYLPYDETIGIYGSYLRFINAGPHGFVTAYVPKVGWISLDLLAYARLHYPVLITGETTDIQITEETLNQVREEYSKYSYIELLATYEINATTTEFIKHVISDPIKTLRSYLNPQNINTTTTPQPPTTSTTPNHTQTTQNTSTEPSLNTHAIFIALSFLITPLLAYMARKLVRVVNHDSLNITSSSSTMSIHHI
ncbi:MAG: hypothetical protein B7O98_04390 [Zestosphaera tikiterensis]|uniref:Transglutaminase-like domain-containing protein n=1 Tax=Zestosphaera tikiterensis TaxID=1973259 RepID=A0A2R7Y851_9CREN|nr:MAG: hypothetical protein B7O98_04390 [Zestosphaera tikiterensis]